MTAVVCRISSTSPTSLPNTCSTSESYSPARPRIYSRWGPAIVAQRNFAIFNKTVWYVPIHLRLRCGTVSWSRGNKNFKKYVPRFLFFCFVYLGKKYFYLDIGSLPADQSRPCTVFSHFPVIFWRFFPPMPDFDEMFCSTTFVLISQVYEISISKLFDIVHVTPNRDGYM